MGMIGGGEGAFIGAVHRMAASLDGNIELVAGSFSSSPEKSLSSGKFLHLKDGRIYSHWEEMLTKEASLSKNERIELVSIVTPNYLHFAPCKLAITLGFNVVCDKPLCLTLEEAEELEALVKKHNSIFAITHNYTGYPMVKQARHMVSNGAIGTIKKIVVGYPQGWLSTLLESTGQKQAAWRTDPSKSGIAGSVGDIGSHGENLAEYITGLKIKSLCADISTLVDGRKLDDDANILLRFDNGAKGILYASQISAGEENSLYIKIYGEKGGLEWHQMKPNSLQVQWLNKPTQIYRTGGPEVCELAKKATRLPAGHPEGYIEAFANIYKAVAEAIKEKQTEGFNINKFDFPKISDGVRGMKFIFSTIKSGNSQEKWIHL